MFMKDAVHAGLFVLGGLADAKQRFIDVLEYVRYVKSCFFTYYVVIGTVLILFDSMV